MSKNILKIECNYSDITTMAKGKKTGGRDFQPGKSGNPNGRPPIPADIKEARALNKTEFERILNLYMNMPWAELVDLIKGEKDFDGNHIDTPRGAALPAIHRVVIKVLLSAELEGDYKRLDMLLDRSIGKVTQPVDHSGNITLEKLVLGSMEGEDEEGKKDPDAGRAGGEGQVLESDEKKSAA